MLHRNEFSGLEFWSCGSKGGSPANRYLAGNSLLPQVESGLVSSCVLFRAACI